MPLRFLLIICLAACIQTAAATNHVILPDGSGDWPTIQAGIDGAAAGDTLLLGAGVFTGEGNRDLNFLGKDLVLTSANGDPSGCIIDCVASETDPHRAFIFENEETAASAICGITMRNGYADGVCCEDLVGGAIRLMYESSPTIVNCVFESNHAVTDGGAILCSSSSCPTIRGCLFIANTAAVGGALNCSGFADPLVIDCTFIGNSASIAPSCGGAVYSKLYAQAQFINCTLFNNNAAQGSGFYFLFGADPRIRNTIIAYGLGGEAVYSESSTPVFSCCDIYGNEGGDWVGYIADQLGVDGNIDSDPLFCDPGLNVLTLHVDSPCLPGVSECDLIGAWPIGCPDTGVSDDTKLFSGRVDVLPNPSFGRCEFRFDAPQNATGGQLVILDESGRIVRSLWQSPRAGGAQNVVWDGRDDFGRDLPAGIYFHELRLGATRSAGRAILLR